MSETNIGKIGFDNILLIFVAILFVVSVVSAVQLNELSGKIASFEKTESQKIVVASGNTSSGNTAKTDQEILDKLSNAPDMVGGC